MEIAKTIAPVCLAIIMFGLGLGLTVADFKRVITIPRDFIIGFFGQVIILPIIAFILIHLISIPPEIALGVMVNAAAPGGGTSNIVTKFADGNLGWIEQIPFDRVIYTAVTEKISKIVFDHINENGIIVAPVVEGNKQILKKFIKINNKIEEEFITEVKFVPNLSGIKE